MELGRHAILDGRGVDPGLLNDPKAMADILRAAVLKSGAMVLSVHAHPFEPQGVTVFLVLAESHASIHTYPEHGEYMADIFTCGKIDPEGAAEELGVVLGGECHLRMLGRGMPAPKHKP